MSEFKIQYKCRSCAEVFDGPIGAEQTVYSAINQAVLKGSCSAFGIPVELITVHTCKDKGFGVADLIGAAAVFFLPI